MGTQGRKKKKDAVPSALEEVRTRVHIHLPVGKEIEKCAANKVLKYIQRYRRRKKLGVDGLTQSLVRPPSYVGWWHQKGWQHEAVSIVIVDLLLEFGSVELSKELATLREEMRKRYIEHGSVQEEFWIVAYPIYRQSVANA